MDGLELEQHLPPILENHHEVRDDGLPLVLWPLLACSALGDVAGEEAVYLGLARHAVVVAALFDRVLEPVVLSAPPIARHLTAGEVVAVCVKLRAAFERHAYVRLEHGARNAHVRLPHLVKVCVAAEVPRDG